MTDGHDGVMDGHDRQTDVTNLNFDIWMHFSSNLVFQKFILRRFGLLTVRAAPTTFTSNKEWRMVELQPKVLCFYHYLPEVLYPVTIFPLIHSSFVLS